MLPVTLIEDVKIVPLLADWSFLVLDTVYLLSFDCHFFVMSLFINTFYLIYSGDAFMVNCNETKLPISKLPGAQFMTGSDTSRTIWVNALT